MKTNATYLTLAFLILLSLSSCAPIGATEHEYGFFHGLLHGFVFIFALIGKIFNANVGLIAENNNGTFYYLGFVIGVMVCCGGGGYGARGRR